MIATALLVSAWSRRSFAQAAAPEPESAGQNQAQQNQAQQNQAQQNQAQQNEAQQLEARQLAAASPAPDPSAAAADTGSFLSSFDVHGFVSQGFLLTVNNEFLAEAKQGSFELSEVGLNVTKRLRDNMSLGIQLFAHDLGPFGNFAPQLDWYHFDYRPYDWLGFRIGRTKVPFGLYNEVNDVDVARVPILLPQSIYQADHREFLFAQTGGEVYGHLRLGAAGALEYRAHGGTLYYPPLGPAAPGVSVTDFKVPYIYGARLLWFTPLDGLLTGFSWDASRYDGSYSFAPPVQAALEGAGLLPVGIQYPTRVKFRVTRWIASLQYAVHDLELSAEYSRWLGEFYSPAPLLFPREVVNERYYVMASYHVASWFTPGVYYSAYFPNVDDRKGREAYQRDLAVTLRYDLSANWLLKLEGHLMRGTAALDNRALNDGVEPPNLAPNWAAFLLKTTAYF